MTFTTWFAMISPHHQRFRRRRRLVGQKSLLQNYQLGTLRRWKKLITQLINFAKGRTVSLVRRMLVTIGLTRQGARRLNGGGFRMKS